jgi:hypothetical protein
MGILWMTLRDAIDSICGTTLGNGWTKFVEPIPNKKDSMSQSFFAKSRAAIFPDNNPSPAK